MKRWRSDRRQLLLSFPTEKQGAEPQVRVYVDGADSVLLLIFGEESQLRAQGSVLPKVLEFARSKGRQLDDRHSEVQYVLTASQGVQQATARPQAEVVVIVDYEHSPTSLDALRRLGESLSSLGGAQKPSKVVVFVDTDKTKLRPEFRQAIETFAHCDTWAKKIAPFNWTRHHPQHPFERVLRHIRQVLAQYCVRGE
jgi:hypothetical protein